ALYTLSLHDALPILVGHGVVLAELGLELDPGGLQSEPDDAAQLAAVRLAPWFEAPRLAGGGLEAVAGAGDEVGERGLVLEHLQRAGQVRHGVVPGRHAGGRLLVRVPAGRHVGVRSMHDRERGAGMARLRVGPRPVAFEADAVAV